MGRSPRCYKPSFVEIRPPVQEKKIFKGFYHIWAWRPFWSCDQHHINNLHTMYLKAYKQNLVNNGLEVSEKSMFYFSYINGLVPRSRNDLDLQYSHTFINSNSCLHLPTFSSQAAIVTEKSTVFTFSHRKAYVTNLTLS